LPHVRRELGAPRRKRYGLGTRAAIKRHSPLNSEAALQGSQATLMRRSQPAQQAFPFQRVPSVALVLAFMVRAKKRSSTPAGGRCATSRSGRYCGPSTCRQRSGRLARTAAGRPLRSLAELGMQRASTRRYSNAAAPTPAQRLSSSRGAAALSALVGAFVRDRDSGNIVLLSTGGCCMARAGLGVDISAAAHPRPRRAEPHGQAAAQPSWRSRRLRQITVNSRSISTRRSTWACCWPRSAAPNSATASSRGARDRHHVRQGGAQRGQHSDRTWRGALACCSRRP
jgi:hypothetical protein